MHLLHHDDGVAEVILFEPCHAQQTYRHFQKIFISILDWQW